MDVTFRTAALATLCNSQRRLADCWGADAALLVGRRLVELRSVDADQLDRLPRAEARQTRRGETIIDFDGEVIVRGVISSDGAGGERIVINSVEANGSVQR